MTGPALDHTFQAVWPVIDSTLSMPALVKEATADLCNVATRHHMEFDRTRGRFALRDAATVPGMSHYSTTVLVYQAPGRALPPRPYHRTRSNR